MRTNLYAHTEAHHPYPAFVSVNREGDGRVLMTVRERGHNGEKMATIELSDEVLDAMSLAFIDVRNCPDELADRAGAAIQQALDRYAERKRLTDAARAYAETNRNRADDCGELARKSLAALDALGA